MFTELRQRKLSSLGPAWQNALRDAEDLFSAKIGGEKRPRSDGNENDARGGKKRRRFDKLASLILEFLPNLFTPPDPSEALQRVNVPRTYDADLTKVTDFSDVFKKQREIILKFVHANHLLQYQQPTKSIWQIPRPKQNDGKYENTLFKRWFRAINTICAILQDGRSFPDGPVGLCNPMIDACRSMDQYDQMWSKANLLADSVPTIGEQNMMIMKFWDAFLQSYAKNKLFGGTVRSLFKQTSFSEYGDRRSSLEAFLRILIQVPVAMFTSTIGWPALTLVGGVLGTAVLHPLEIKERVIRSVGALCEGLTMGSRDDLLTANRRERAPDELVQDPATASFSIGISSVDEFQGFVLSGFAYVVAFKTLFSRFDKMDSGAWLAAYEIIHRNAAKILLSKPFLEYVGGKDVKGETGRNLCRQYLGFFLFTVVPALVVILNSSIASFKDAPPSLLMALAVKQELLPWLSQGLKKVWELFFASFKDGNILYKVPFYVVRYSLEFFGPQVSELFQLQNFGPFFSQYFGNSFGNFDGLYTGDFEQGTVAIANGSPPFIRQIAVLFGTTSEEAAFMDHSTTLPFGHRLTGVVPLTSISFLYFFKIAAWENMKLGSPNATWGTKAYELFEKYSKMAPDRKMEDLSQVASGIQIQNPFNADYENVDRYMEARIAKNIAYRALALLNGGQRFVVEQVDRFAQGYLGSISDIIVSFFSAVASGGMIHEVPPYDLSRIDLRPFNRGFSTKFEGFERILPRVPDPQEKLVSENASAQYQKDGADLGQNLLLDRVYDITLPLYGEGELYSTIAKTPFFSKENSTYKVVTVSLVVKPAVFPSRLVFMPVSGSGVEEVRCTYNFPATLVTFEKKDYFFSAVRSKEGEVITHRVDLLVRYNPEEAGGQIRLRLGLEYQQGLVSNGNTIIILREETMPGDEGGKNAHPSRSFKCNPVDNVIQPQGAQVLCGFGGEEAFVVRLGVRKMEDRASEIVGSFLTGRVLPFLLRGNLPEQSQQAAPVSTPPEDVSDSSQPAAPDPSASTHPPVSVFYGGPEDEAAVDEVMQTEEAAVDEVVQILSLAYYKKSIRDQFGKRNPSNDEMKALLKRELDGLFNSYNKHSKGLKNIFPNSEQILSGDIVDVYLKMKRLFAFYDDKNKTRLFFLLKGNRQEILETLQERAFQWAPSRVFLEDL